MIVPGSVVLPPYKVMVRFFGTQFGFVDLAYSHSASGRQRILRCLLLAELIALFRDRHLCVHARALSPSA